MSRPTDKAKVIARIAHAGQVDKAGNPYINHLARVAASRRLKIYADITVAWLHDIVEDTEVTLQDLKDLGFDGMVVDAVRLLTRDEDTVYIDYIYRIAGIGGPALRVKLADLDDHLDDPDAIPDTLVKRYEKAREILESRL